MLMHFQKALPDSLAGITLFMFMGDYPCPKYTAELDTALFLSCISMAKKV